jgi:hypothetical protein
VKFGICVGHFLEGYWVAGNAVAAAFRQARSYRSARAAVSRKMMAIGSRRGAGVSSSREHLSQQPCESRLV